MIRYNELAVRERALSGLSQSQRGKEHEMSERGQQEEPKKD